MMENNYSRACTEALKIIDLFSIEDYEKIPESLINILEENKDESYVFEYDYTKDLIKQDIEDLTRGIISNLYKDFIANDTEKNEIIIIENNQLKEEENLKRQKYNPENLFKNNQKNEDEEKSGNNMKLIEIKKLSWYNKIFKKLLSIFGTKN